MKKILSICAIALLFTSCSNDDDNSGQEQFFNLKEGNFWVYKEYNVSEEFGEYFKNVDTVKVEGTEIIDGKTYFRLSHTNSGLHEDSEYVRVDEAGHLVNELDVVIHPGSDLSYAYNYISDYGELKYSMQSPEEISVEGQSYNVYPYTANLIPNEGSSIPGGLGNYVCYKSGVGCVLNGARFVSGAVYVEQRLVYYEIN